MGRYHHRHPGAHPHHAATSSHTTATGNVLPQQVRSPGVFPRLGLTYFVKLQKVEWFVLVGIEVASYGGLQKIVG
jgi:hypothetical protein